MGKNPTVEWVKTLPVERFHVYYFQGIIPEKGENSLTKLILYRIIAI